MIIQEGTPYVPYPKIGMSIGFEVTVSLRITFDTEKSKIIITENISILGLKVSTSPENLTT